MVYPLPNVLVHTTAVDEILPARFENRHKSGTCLKEFGSTPLYMEATQTEFERTSTTNSLAFLILSH